MSVHWGGRGPGHMARGFGPAPSLWLDFLSGLLDDRISFTRASAATYVNSAGNIVSTPASKNLLTFTEEFDNAAWTKTNATITANSVAAPDGLMTADSLIENSSTAIHNTLQNYTAASGPTYTLSVYAKLASGSRYLTLATGDGSCAIATFDLQAGTISGAAAIIGANWSSPSAQITAAGDGWYRCSVSGTSVASGSRSAYFTLNSTGSNPAAGSGASYAGNGTSGVYLWGAQLETGSTATSYVRNFGGLFPPRFDYDPVTLQPRGLLIEEQRTNLLVRSEEFDNASWTKSAVTATANATTSPDGTVDADSLVADTSTGGHQATQTATTTATATTFSVYAKQNGYTWVALGITDSGSTVRVSYFNLAAGTVGTVGTGITASIVNAGNGWYRCIVTVATALAGSNTLRVYVTNADNTTSFTGDGTSGIFVWGAQLEAASFATSYIPTTTSQVTRAADQASIVAPMFAPWYNQSEGAFVVEYSMPAPTVAQIKALVSANTGSTNDRVYMYVSNSGIPNELVTVGGVAQANIGNGLVSANTVVRTAMSYKADDFAISTAGGAAATDTSGAVPAVNRLEIGAMVGGNQPNGHIRRIAYYPSRLSNAQLQALSA